MYSMKIDIWTDIVCPFCYIGNTQFNKALNSFAHKDSVEVVHHSFQLMPDAPKSTDLSASEALAKSKGISVQEAKQMNAQVAASGEKEGLTMRMEDTQLINTFDGHRLIHFAATKGKQEETMKALYEAHFAKAVSIADTDELVKIAKQVGLDGKQTRKILESDQYSDDVKADIERAASLGVQGVPFFVIDDKYGVSGAQGVEGFKKALQQAWHEKHPLQMVGSDNPANTCTDETCV